MFDAPSQNAGKCPCEIVAFDGDYQRALRWMPGCPKGHAIPSDTRLTVPDVLPRFRAYVRTAGNEVGGSLHLVLSDFNTESSHVEFCEHYAAERGNTEGAALARLLLAMTRTQRLKIAHRCWDA